MPLAWWVLFIISMVGGVFIAAVAHIRRLEYVFVIRVTLLVFGTGMFAHLYDSRCLFHTRLLRFAVARLRPLRQA